MQEALAVDGSRRNRPSSNGWNSTQVMTAYTLVYEAENITAVGSFFLTMFSMAPMWKSLDPLPAVSNRQRLKTLEDQKKDKSAEDKEKSEVGHMFDHSPAHGSLNTKV